MNVTRKAAVKQNPSQGTWLYIPRYVGVMYEHFTAVCILPEAPELRTFPSHAPPMEDHNTTVNMFNPRTLHITIVTTAVTLTARHIS